jgi:hypothetical protein
MQQVFRVVKKVAIVATKRRPVARRKSRSTFGYQVHPESRQRSMISLRDAELFCQSPESGRESLDCFAVLKSFRKQPGDVNVSLVIE